MTNEAQIIDNLVHNRKWHDCGVPRLESEVTQLSQEEFHKIIDMHDQLIHEQKREINKLKHRNRSLETSLRKKNQIISRVIK